MRSPMPERARLVLALGLLPVLAAACVKPDAPGVTVKGLTADIVFGVKDPTKPALPPGAEPDDTDESFGQGFEFELPDFALGFPSKKERPVRPPREVPECAPTPVGKFPEKPVEVRTKPPQLPAEGLYRFVRKGQAITYPGGSKKTYDTFEQRRILNAKPVNYIGMGPDPTPDGPDWDFTYETLQPSLDNKSVLTTRYEVHNETIDRDVNNPAGGQRAGGGDPERGVVIKGYKRVSADKNETNLGESNFNPGLLIVPLEIRPGERWESTVSDGRSGLGIRLTGEVVKPVQVLTCGDVVAGYQISTVWTIKPSARESAGTDSPSYTRYYDFVYAPQLGGIIVEEKVREDTRYVQQCASPPIKSPSTTQPPVTSPTDAVVDPKAECRESPPAPTGVASDLLFHIGQIEPSPVVNPT